MTEDSQKENQPEQTEQKEVVYEDTRHEPHKHAHPRILIGVIAVILLAVGCFVWARWGGQIKEACFGDNGACVVEIATSTLEANAFEVDATNF